MMGNVLESDTSSLSENEVQDTVLLTETRTQGDGMESENGVGASSVDGAAFMTEKSGGHLISENIRQVEAGPLALPHKGNSSYQRTAGTERESPKQLPPRDQLIMLKPAKLVEKAMGENSNNAYNKLVPASTSTKQKEPKFVPYEPYKGATRLMTTDDDSTKAHSRKPSLGSSNSSSSIRSTKAEPLQFTKVPQTMPQLPLDGVGLKSAPRGELGSDSFMKQGHSEILLKERLKICDKDINELRTENSRLKKMLVDSLSGFGSPPSAEDSQAARRSIHMHANGSSMSESVDNLTDEIEVWRSKFLSSCVLVEQLTKENQDWKQRVSSAAEIFRETKQSTDVVLTPLLFDKINSWLLESRSQLSSGSDKTLSLYPEPHDISNDWDPTSS